MRSEDVGATRGGYPVAAAQEGHVALEDIERFILEMMRVIWRCKPWWHQVLHESERAIGRLPGRSQDGWKPEKVERRFGGCVDLGLQALCDHRVLLADSSLPLPVSPSPRSGEGGPIVAL